MPRYLAAHSVNGTIQPHGWVEAEESCTATLEAQKRWPGCGVVPEDAVERWMRRGAAVNEARNLVASER